jgi:hypothetical protein
MTDAVCNLFANVEFLHTHRIVHADSRFIRENLPPPIRLICGYGIVRR